MKKMYVLDRSGEKLFEGTRHECKQFIRKNKLSRASLSEYYSEKVVSTPETFTELNEVSEDELDNYDEEEDDGKI